jgi:hypothetical protein
MAAPAAPPILNRLSVEVLCQCIAQDADGTECQNFTVHSDVCAFHLSRDYGLRIGASTVSGAGLGLFATRDFAKGERVCQYKGKIVSRAAFEAEPSLYGVGLSGGLVLDAVLSSAGAGRYVNSAPRKRDVNCQLISLRKILGRRAPAGSGKVIYVQCTKRVVRAGEEWFCLYGNNYSWPAGVHGL